jgi:hypothetical protein
MRRCCLGLLLLLFTNVHAQSDEGSGANVIGGNATYELGLHLGELLPNQIIGVTEIMGLGGARVAFRLAPLSYVEFGGIFGNGEGQEWKNGHADVRADFPVQNLVGLAYVGADGTYFSGAGHGDRLIFGGHIGGGMQAHLLGSCWFRGDMKFNFSPGTSLYFGFGLVWRLGTGTGGGGE